jgi:hypothetical protein
MSMDVHHRAEGDVTGLGAASRAGAHVSCWNRPRVYFVWVQVCLFDPTSSAFHIHHPSSLDVVRIHHDGLIYL